MDKIEKNILVLGGGGLIGSHLVEVLLRLDQVITNITVLDNMKYCYSDNLNNVRDDIDVSVSDARQVFEYLTKKADDNYYFDEIYNLAGVVAAEDFMKYPLEAYWVSVMSMNGILEYKRLINEKVKLLFTSSSEVYGNAEVIPTPEEYIGAVKIDGVRSGYDEGKRSAETIISAYRRMYDINSMVVRIFNTFGERQLSNGRLVSTMVKDALKYNRINVNMPGTQTRALLYVEDCVKLLISAMNNQVDIPVNVGGVEQLRMWDVAWLIRDLIKKKFDKVITISPTKEIEDDIKSRMPDISRAKEIYGWKPNISIEDGINKVIDYWSNRL